MGADECPFHNSGRGVRAVRDNSGVLTVKGLSDVTITSVSSAIECDGLVRGSVGAFTVELFYE